MTADDAVVQQPEDGCWAVFSYGEYGAQVEAVYGSEVEALRHAVDRQWMHVVWLPWGVPVGEAAK